MKKGMKWSKALISTAFAGALLFGIGSGSSFAAELPVHAQFTPSNQTVKSGSAAYFQGSWGGGNGTSYNVVFSYGDGSYSRLGTVYKTTHQFKYTYYLNASQTRDVFYPQLNVSSGLSSYTARGTITIVK